MHIVSSLVLPISPHPSRVQIQTLTSPTPLPARTYLRSSPAVRIPSYHHTGLVLCYKAGREHLFTPVYPLSQEENQCQLLSNRLEDTEYLVFLYCLAIGPFLFQMFFNQVIWEFLCRSIIVCINDILIYAPLLE
ncbi:hypothetical protein P4O66_020190 [Electrophorus voltai]|uniref:Uncharacterized protein n=1 Tax=Electrophorus voltai TaxID=2609070 RepID=A0AAD9E3X2_9TELE|nr:hypothetical protein P4O66_020190 [Electrophorus voltai]